MPEKMLTDIIIQPVSSNIYLVNKKHKQLVKLSYLNLFLGKTKKSIMKTMSFLRITVIVACIGLFFACSKNNSGGSNSTTTTVDDLQTQSDDQTMASNEDDATNSDADAALSSSASIAGSSLNATPVNGAIAEMGVNGIDSTSTNIICDATITYDTTST